MHYPNSLADDGILLLRDDDRKLNNSGKTNDNSTKSQNYPCCL
jgi:hypothetical protein